MNIEDSKAKIIANLKKLEVECNLLLERIPVFIDKISEITTEEEAEEFNKTYNIEEGLEIIELF